MNLKSLIVLGLLGALIVIQAHAEDQSAITQITIHAPKWDEQIDEDGNELYLATFKALFEPIEIRINSVFVPYEASIKDVQSKECDVAMSVYLNEFPGVLYPKWAQELEQTIVAHRVGTPYVNERSLSGKKVAWLRGYGYQKYLPKDVDFTEVRTEVLGLRMLDRGQVDYFIDYDPSIQAAAKMGNIDMSAITLSPVDALSKPVYPIFRDDDRGRRIMAIYDRRMAELYADGTLDLIFRNLGNDHYPESLKP